MEKKIGMRDWNWEITNKCNLRCLHCIVGECHRCELTTREVLIAISRIVKLGGKNIKLTGGEPLMRKDINLIIQEAHSLGLNVDLITNGTMLNDDFLKKYAGRINHIAVSIDGPKKIHDYIRGKESYERAILALKKTMEFDIDLSAYITIHALNENLIDLLIEELILIGVRSFHFNEINIEGRASENRHLILRPNRIEDRLENLISQLSRNIEIDKISLDSSCSISPESVYLKSDGRIYACVEIAFKAPEQKIAHILDPEVGEKISHYFLKEVDGTTHKCCYTSFSMSGISILFNEQKKCPLTRRIDNESSFK